MNKIKIILAGTAEIATPLLRSLSEDKRFNVCLVITQADRPAGRKMKLTPSPIKRMAEELELEIFQPESINTTESIEVIQKKKADTMVVMAYGQIFSKKILNASKKCINIHASLLPKYRGASPIQCAISNMGKETGISLMKMSEKMDEGDVYSKFSIPIEDNDNSVTIETKLAHLTACKIPDALHIALQDNAKPIPQDESKATHCHKITKTDGLINWNEDVKIIEAKIRAFTGWPGTYTFFNGKSLKIIESRYKKLESNNEPGTVLKTDNSIAIIAKNGVILPTYVQIEGKKAQSINDFINGNPDFINSKLG